MVHVVTPAPFTPLLRKARAAVFAVAETPGSRHQTSRRLSKERQQRVEFARTVAAICAPRSSSCSHTCLLLFPPQSLMCSALAHGCTRRPLSAHPCLQPNVLTGVNTYAGACDHRERRCPAGQRAPVAPSRSSKAVLPSRRATSRHVPSGHTIRRTSRVKRTIHCSWSG